MRVELSTVIIILSSIGVSSAQKGPPNVKTVKPAEVETPSIWFYPNEQCEGDVYSDEFSLDVPEDDACQTLANMHGIWLQKDDQDPGREGCVYAYKSKDCRDGSTYYPIPLHFSHDETKQIPIVPLPGDVSEETGPGSFAQNAMLNFEPQSYKISNEACYEGAVVTDL